MRCIPSLELCTQDIDVLAPVVAGTSAEHILLLDITAQDNEVLARVFVQHHYAEVNLCQASQCVRQNPLFLSQQIRHSKQ